MAKAGFDIHGNNILGDDGYEDIEDELEHFDDDEDYDDEEDDDFEDDCLDEDEEEDEEDY